jgi:hypothetical protein
MGHYDSVATGQGAGDNGSGVATLLETLRVLRNDAPLKNDLVYVFTDGEEDGGLGAQAFVDEHPWFKDVSVAVVADSNGCGVVAMSAFARHNGWLIREATRAAPHAVAASIGDEVGKLSGGLVAVITYNFCKRGYQCWVLEPLGAKLRTTRRKTISVSLILVLYKTWATMYCHWLATSAISI